MESPFKFRKTGVKKEFTKPDSKRDEKVKWLKAGDKAKTEARVESKEKEEE